MVLQGAPRTLDGVLEVFDGALMVFLRRSLVYEMVPRVQNMFEMFVKKL